MYKFFQDSEFHLFFIILKALCEKGLAAMDNSHKRTIADLEEKHRQEIESLRFEKDQALAEETQATLAGSCDCVNLLTSPENTKDFKIY